ncbi:MAG: hypothetical protein E7231_08750 [Cellulosilyticum sp.]|nr:hypothetical protein [Cellulosilyticum sp.]
MFFKKEKADKGKVKDESVSKQDTKKQENEGGNSPLLERYLQKNMTDHMRNVDDEALAKAIKTLLYEEGNKNKHLN